MCSMHATVHMWQSGDILRQLVLSFHCVGPRDWTQVLILSGWHPYLLSHLVNFLALPAST